MFPNLTQEQQDEIVGKLIQLKYDPYKQLELYGEENIVWSVTATLSDGSHKEITLTSIDAAGVGFWQLANPFQYKLFTQTGERIFWEHIQTIQ
jgi:hypothetical protein